MTEKPLLNDKDSPPDATSLKGALGLSFFAYQKFIDHISSAPLNLNPQWNYYNDGKAWLCKILFKKKTICWLSVWDNHFKVSFYFTEKNADGVIDLSINESVKSSFEKNSLIGKLKPLILTITDATLLDDAITIINFKKNLK